MKRRGDTFGEVSLMYNSPRGATVAATQDSVVWVLERDVFRAHARVGQETATQQVELFLNSVPILSALTKEEKLVLVDAAEEAVFPPGTTVVRQGDAGDAFFIIKDGEAVVYQEERGGGGDGAGGAASRRRVNQLFRSDFFGEQALLGNVPRAATVESVTRLVCLVLGRETFTAVLGPLEALLKREKSPQVVNQRLLKLQARGGPTRIPAEVVVRRKQHGSGEWDVVRTRGHADEVEELGGTSVAEAGGTPRRQLVVTEGMVLGTGAFSRVCVARDEAKGRTFALKRMRKSGVVQCPEHVFCEQTITRNLTHPFCIRQYASFQDKYHLYFLMDYMGGGDLMDVLVADAHVISVRKDAGGVRQGCFAPKVKVLKGLDNSVARFYVASLVLALDYLHQHNIVYRDLKPEKRAGPGLQLLRGLVGPGRAHVRAADGAPALHLAQDRRPHGGHAAHRGREVPHRLPALRPPRRQGPDPEAAGAPARTAAGHAGGQGGRHQAPRLVRGLRLGCAGGAQDGPSAPPQRPGCHQAHSGADGGGAPREAPPGIGGGDGGVRGRVCRLLSGTRRRRLRQRRPGLVPLLNGSFPSIPQVLLLYPVVLPTTAPPMPCPCLTTC
ncbi:FAP295 [Auxenochlorella protothecoides x Auxenochlorella symbiontica]